MSTETQRLNAYDYPCFNLTTAICDNAGEGFNLKSVAAAISIVVFPIIVAVAVLEAIFDVLAFPVVLAFNCLISMQAATTQEREDVDTETTAETPIVNGHRYQVRENGPVPQQLRTFSPREIATAVSY